jgi:hypothetical protein
MQWFDYGKGAVWNTLNCEDSCCSWGKCAQCTFQPRTVGYAPVRKLRQTNATFHEIMHCLHHPLAVLVASQNPQISEQGSNQNGTTCTQRSLLMQKAQPSVTNVHTAYCFQGHRVWIHVVGTFQKWHDTHGDISRVPQSVQELSVTFTSKNMQVNILHIMIYDIHLFVIHNLHNILIF